MAADELVRDFVLASHGDLGKVRSMLVEHPELLELEHDWGPQGGLENAIGAASHVGNREIAEFLISRGAMPTICTWAMLGRRDQVAAALEADPGQANARGAHGITVLFHTAMSGDTGKAPRLATLTRAA